MAAESRTRKFLRFVFLFAVLVTIAVVAAITTIRLTIHGHQEKLPNLVGQQIAQARDTASSLGLHVDVADKLFNVNYPSDSIISQMPPAGTPIKPRQHVHVLLSLGPPQATVPDVLGRSFRAARITAVESGLTIGDVAAVYWPTGSQDDVLAQDPPPATTDLQTPAVNFLVSLGQQRAAFLCPKFAGKSIDSVRAELEKAGFNDIQVTQQQVLGAAPGTILQQVPFAGSKITTETTFHFQVAQ